MANRKHLIHERMLNGAVDSYIGQLVHQQPYLADDYETALEGLADSWLDQGGTNFIDAVDEAWLQEYLHQSPKPAELKTILNEFYTWVGEQKLMKEVLQLA